MFMQLSSFFLLFSFYIGLDLGSCFRSISKWGLSPFGSIRHWNERPLSRTYVLKQNQILVLNTDSGSDVTLETFVLRFVRGLKCPNSDMEEAQDGKCTVDSVVDLYGVLHVADSSYYRELSEILTQYDVILYELITSNSNVDLIYERETMSLSKQRKLHSNGKKQAAKKHKYLGAALAGNGDIYGVPSHARKLLRISGNGGNKLSLLSLINKKEGVPIPMNKKFKWLRGQIYKESMYCIPAWADSVLKVSLCTAGDRTIEATEMGKDVLGQVMKVLKDAGQDSRWLYHGAAEGRDGCIYAIPCNAEFVLKIDPVADEVCLVGNHSSAQFGRLFGVQNKAKFPAGGNKWYGGIRGMDGCVYGVPYCTRDGVLKITPPLTYSRKSEADVSILPIRSSPHMKLIDRSNDLDGSVDEGKGCRWHGGVLNPADGCIYAIPSHSRRVLRINTNPKGSIDSHGIRNNDSAVHVIGRELCIPAGSYKWGGGVVGADGRVYGIPSDSDKVLVIDPSKPTSPREGIRRDDRENCIDNQVRLLDIPSYASEAQDEGEQDLPRKNKWQGGILVGKSIYCFPCNAVSVLKISTPDAESTEQAVITEIGWGVIPKGRCKWQGGHYNLDDRCIYCVPEHGDSVLRINCSDDSISLLPLPGLYEPDNFSNSKGSEPRSYVRPRRRLNTEIQSPTAAALANEYNLRTQLDLPMSRDKRYFLADLDSETITNMENDRDLRERLQTSFQVSREEGLLSGSSSRDLLFDKGSSSTSKSRNTFRVDGPFLTVARLVSWLTPAPELTQLLLDWSRSRDRATTGGVTLSSLNAACHLFLSSFSPRTFFLPSKEGLARAKQILFAQQLVSGVADDGWFGGSALSNVDIRVKKRNKAALEVLNGVLKDEDRPRIAVLYGVYHLRDLAQRFEKIGLTHHPELRMPDDVPVLSMEGENGQDLPKLPPNNSLIAWRVAMPPAASSDGLEKYSAALLVGSLYLLVSTLDWLVLLRLVINAVEAIPLLPSIVSMSSISGDLPIAIPKVSIDRISDDQVVDFSLGVLYLSLYIRRHIDILVSFTTGIVDWNKGLYDDD